MKMKRINERNVVFRLANLSYKILYLILLYISFWFQWPLYYYFDLSSTTFTKEATIRPVPQTLKIDKLVPIKMSIIYP